MSTKGDEKRIPGTVEDVYDDYRGRRTAICKALTSDFEEFYRQCDPARDNLCLYGHPDETWEVNPPVDEIPPDLPEPTLGINFARGMQRKDWLCLVAVHSDAWLLAISSFYGSYFDRHDRKRLFNMISELPTILEVVTGRKSVKDKPSVINVGTKNKPSGKPGEKPQGPELHRKPSKESHLEEVVVTTTHEEGDEHGDTLCGACGSSYGSNEFWICCDICEKWYHGKCVKITPAMAEHINQYKCPLCHVGKRARQ